MIFDILPSLLLAPCKFCVVLLFLELRGSNRTLKYCRIWGYLLHFEYFCCTTKNYKTIHFTTWSLPNITFFTHLHKFCNTLFVKLYQGTTVKLENVNFSQNFLPQVHVLHINMTQVHLQLVYEIVYSYTVSLYYFF